MAPESSIVPAGLSVAGAIISGVLAAWSGVRARRQDRMVEMLKLQVTTYDTKLLEQRLKNYRDLWSRTEATSQRYIALLSQEASEVLAEQLTTWYYAGGGMILSAEARNAFFSARNSLQFASGVCASKSHKGIVAAFSSLRTAMCEDLNSRRGPTSISQLEETGSHARVRMADESRREQQMRQG